MQEDSKISQSIERLKNVRSKVKKSLYTNLNLHLRNEHFPIFIRGMFAVFKPTYLGESPFIKMEEY